MQSLPTLKPGDSVEIIAPASRCTDQRIAAVKELLASWQLNCLVADDIFGKDLFCANTDEIRFKNLKAALLNPQTKAVICVRGGYGSMRLIPALSDLEKPSVAKLFVGMSDTTALHLFLQNEWLWPTVHAGIAPDIFSKESLQALHALLFGEIKQAEFSSVQPLNQSAKQLTSLTAVITGGNLSLVQAGMGTRWQMVPNEKILLLEEVGERAYRVDRMLEHLRQANVFATAKAIIFADFLDGNEPNGTNIIMPTLERFADHSSIPVFKLNGIGHGATNYPIPLGVSATLMGQQGRLLVDVPWGAVMQANCEAT